MDPLFSDLDNGMSPDNTKDFEEMMSKTLELGNLSAQTMSSTLHLPGLSECQGDGSSEHATAVENIEVSPYFPPPSPVSPDVSFLALNFDPKDQAEESVNLQEQSEGDADQVHKRIRYPTQPNSLGNMSPSPHELPLDAFAVGQSNRKSIGIRETQETPDAKNGMILGRELAKYVTEYANRQVYFRAQSQEETPFESNGELFPEKRLHTNQSTQQAVILKRNVLKDENPEHGLQALLQLLSESSGPPRKKAKIDHRLRYVMEPEFAVHTTNKTVATPGVIDAIAKEFSGKNVSEQQNTAQLTPQLPNDAWTDLLRTGDKDDMMYNAPAAGAVRRQVSERSPLTLQPDAMPIMQPSGADLKLRLATPLDDAWFLSPNLATPVNSGSIHRAENPNDPGFVASNETKHATNISNKLAQPCSVVPQIGPQIEILYPNALRNKSPKAVRCLLRATGDDIVSKIDLYWSHFHDYRASAERAGRLLREKSVRFERRKRMGPEVPAIEKKAIRAQRNRERSQALRRYHKQRMGDLEAVSGQLKLYNSVARSLINCLLEEPQSLELVQEYFGSHECSEELLTYLRSSL